MNLINKIAEVASSALSWIIKSYRKRKTLMVILVVYLIICGIYHHYFLIKDNWIKLRPALENIDTGFAVSFSASLFEDLLMFVALSVLVIVLTNKPINTYSYVEKISAIINSSHAKNSDGVNAYLQTTINNILGYTKKFDIELSIADYNKEQTAYKIFIEQTYLIANICNDKDYRLEEYGEFSAGIFDASPNGKIGKVTLCDLTDMSVKNSTPIPFVDPRTPYYLKTEYRKKIDLGLQKDQTKRVRLNYEGWSKTCQPDDKFKIDIWNQYTSNRYAEEVVLHIENIYNKPIEYEVYSHMQRLKSDKGLTLQSKGVIMPNKKLDPPVSLQGKLYPGDDVRVYFYPQEETV